MHPIEAPNDNFRLLIRQASALCVLVHSLYIALFVWARVDALAWLNLNPAVTPWPADPVLVSVAR